MRLLFLLFRILKVQSFAKGEVFIQAGATKKDIFFIRQGLVRSYFVDEKLEEITFQLYAETNVFGNVHTILLNEPSKFSYQALEPTKVYTVDYDVLMDEISNNPKLSGINRRYIGEKILKQAFQRVESFVFLSPEERYQKYIKDNPNVVNRAPDKYIANVLGVTSVSLSRIRNRIATKKN